MKWWVHFHFIHLRYEYIHFAHAMHINYRVLISHSRYFLHIQVRAGERIAILHEMEKSTCAYYDGGNYFRYSHLLSRIFLLLLQPQRGTRQSLPNYTASCICGACGFFLYVNQSFRFGSTEVCIQRQWYTFVISLHIFFVEDSIE